MAGFFSLGGRRQNKAEEEEQQQEDQREENSNVNNSSQFLFRNVVNEEIYNKGFEIWPQTTSSYHHQNHNNSNYYSFGVGPSRRNNTNNNNDSPNDDVSVSFSDESNRFGFTVMRSGGGGGSGGGMNCQDCGNQAKKDCAHLRCRTCCKSRGFQCQTHVKSTWVPAAKRRERQQQLSALQQHNQQQPHFRPDHSKRHRDNIQTSSAPVPITTTGLELGQFPPELNSPAVFRCVKVSAMDAPDERFAYQTAVNIGGHVFKGILYDQGSEGPYTGCEGSSGGVSGGSGEAQPLNLIAAATTAVATSGGNPFDPSLYTAPLNAFMAGTQFFPPPRT